MNKGGLVIILGMFVCNVLALTVVTGNTSYIMIVFSIICHVLVIAITVYYSKVSPINRIGRALLAVILVDLIVLVSGAAIIAVVPLSVGGICLVGYSFARLRHQSGGHNTN